MPEINSLKCLKQIELLTDSKDTQVILYSAGINDELSKIAITNGATLREFNL